MKDKPNNLYSESTSNRTVVHDDMMAYKYDVISNKVEAMNKYSTLYIHPEIQ